MEGVKKDCNTSIYINYNTRTREIKTSTHTKTFILPNTLVDVCHYYRKIIVSDLKLSYNFLNILFLSCKYIYTFKIKANGMKEWVFFHAPNRLQGIQEQAKLTLNVHSLPVLFSLLLPTEWWQFGWTEETPAELSWCHSPFSFPASLFIR